MACSWRLRGGPGAPWFDCRVPMASPRCARCTMVSPWRAHDASMVRRGVSMICPCCPHDGCMVGSVRHGMFMACPWCLHGGSNASWCVHCGAYGAFMVGPLRHGVFIACLCCAHSASMMGPEHHGLAVVSPWSPWWARCTIVSPWCISMAPPWCLHGVPIVPSWCSMVCP